LKALLELYKHSGPRLAAIVSWPIPLEAQAAGPRLSLAPRSHDLAQQWAQFIVAVDTKASLLPLLANPLRSGDLGQGITALFTPLGGRKPD
jgi:hypothetical protein